LNQTSSHRKYSLILTLYTSGSLEGYLAQNRNLNLTRDDPRLRKWAFQIANGMEYVASKVASPESLV
jgi:hypothetical protein